MPQGKKTRAATSAARRRADERMAGRPSGKTAKYRATKAARRQAARPAGAPTKLQEHRGSMVNNIEMMVAGKLDQSGARANSTIFRSIIKQQRQFAAKSAKEASEVQRDGKRNRRAKGTTKRDEQDDEGTAFAFRSMGIVRDEDVEMEAARQAIRRRRTAKQTGKFAEASMDAVARAAAGEGEGEADLDAEADLAAVRAGVTAVEQAATAANDLRGKVAAEMEKEALKDRRNRKARVAERVQRRRVASEARAAAQKAADGMLGGSAGGGLSLDAVQGGQAAAAPSGDQDDDGELNFEFA